MTVDQKKQLEGKLWDIANQLRGKISADDYRDYILGFIFYKYLSEKQSLHAQALLEEEEITDFHEAVKDEEYLDAIKEDALGELGFFLMPDQLFTSVVNKAKEKVEGKYAYIIDDLESVFRHIEQSTAGTESEDDFNALFEDIDLQSTKIGRSPAARNEVVAAIMCSLEEIDFKLTDSESDVLGDAYEYLIGEFASKAGKKAGEFYTPQQVSKVLAKLVITGKERLKSVYDPTCGSGSLLLRVAREMKNKTGKGINVNDFVGQEMNRTTYNLARMNMLMHGVHYRDFDIRHEDTLEHPQHINERFEAVVANPPFSAHWASSNNPSFDTDERFSQYGKLAPKTKADYAFVQHMIHQLDDNGIMACVLPHGVLFRGAAEGHIRRYLIEEKNYLDAVIGLPANIFYGTSIPTCILVFKKCREAGDNILFIDASGEGHFTKEGTQNVLRNEDVDLIIDTYHKREASPKYSYVASMEEVRENDYNLNIPRYVDTFEEEEPIDIAAVAEELQAIEKDLCAANDELAAFCNELNIPTPF